MLDRAAFRFVALIALFLPLSVAPGYGQQFVRTATKNTLSSSALPDIKIVLDRRFRYAGNHAITIRDVATGERYIFVDAVGKKIRRMFIAQFEAILPTSDVTYNYKFDKAKSYGGHKFRQNTFAFSNAEARAENPNGEAALTHDFLKNKGFRLEDELMMSRFVTVPDAERKHELILFYIENVTATGRKVSEFYKGDDETEAWKTISEGLTERSLRAFSIPDRRL